MMKGKGRKGEIDDEATASGKNPPPESLSLSEIPSFPATTERWGDMVKGQAMMKGKGEKGEIDDEDPNFVTRRGKNLPTESLSISEIPSLLATTGRWGGFVEDQVMTKVKGRKGRKREIADECRAILDSIVAEEEAKKAEASGKNLPTESLSISEIPSLLATTGRWGGFVKDQVLTKVKGRKGRKGEIADECRAILDSIVAEEEAKKAEASGKNLPTESLSLSEIPSFPATTERWGEFVKGQVMTKGKGRKGEIDDEGRAIFDSIVAEEEAKKDAASGKDLPTESLSLSEIPSFPATAEHWGEIVKGQAMMKGKGEIGDECRAILDSIVAEEEEATKENISLQFLCGRFMTSVLLTASQFCYSFWYSFCRLQLVERSDLLNLLRRHLLLRKRRSLFLLLDRRPAAMKGKGRPSQLLTLLKPGRHLPIVTSQDSKLQNLLVHRLVL